MVDLEELFEERLARNEVDLEATPAFRDHELCDQKPYLNYIVNIPLAAKFVESYHPNAKGQSVFARLAESTLQSRKG